MSVEGNCAALRSKVAIIGAACRFPGGSNDPQAFFANLLEGRTFCGTVPADRWSGERFTNEDDKLGKSYVGRGHFLHDYDFKAFDADFFGLSPREVEFIDPQQRLMLELAWEALEDAGLDADALAGTATGVFVGGFTVDHLLNQFGSAARDAIGSHSAAGATLTMLSNRVSYALDLCGPSLSIDTACSSSLVAFAQAVRAIETGECRAALVGGVNFILRPEYMIAMAKGRFLARDGRSKSFDARADGYGRGEGGAMVVLKDHDAALADGDTILAVIDGVGVNQDGRTSGITVPNPEAQRALMTRVLAASGLAPTDVDYVEAHGTGTKVGDSRETRAITEVYGMERPCIVGSVKANIGHLEAAAGVASIVKAVMMLRHGLVPPVAGLEEINPEIPEAIVVPREVMTLGAEDAGVRRIAINSFGYGGTNAHVILRSAGPAGAPQRPATVAPSTLVLPFSARSRDALVARAGAMAAVLDAGEDGDLPDLLFTAGARRTHLPHRMSVWGADRTALARALRAFAGNDVYDGADGERSPGADGRIAFVYTGMGPQWWGMGRQLFVDNAAFRGAVEEADALFRRIAGFSIVEEMLRDEATSRIKRTEYAQPANLMVQIGLTAALAAEGIVADAVVGHSVGEVASGWASGMLTLEDALLVSRERSRVQAKAAGQGGMLALGVTRAEAEELIRPHGGLVSFAAVNAPAALTLAGDRVALEAILKEANARKLFARMLDVEVPYHSPLMEPLKPELRDVLASLTPGAPARPLYSTVTGHAIDAACGRRFDAEYWCDNVREPVHFADAIGAMIADGYTLFVEVGPHPVLRRSIVDIATAAGREVRLVSTLRMEQPETPALRRAVCEVYAAGGVIDWRARTPAGRQVALPAYPWQRDHLWRETAVQAADRCAEPGAPLSGGDATGLVDLTAARLNYLADHVVDGAAIMPAAGYLEALAQEARRLWPEAPGLCLEDVQIRTALLLDPHRAQRLEVRVDRATGRAELHSRDIADPAYRVLHCEATLRPCHGTAAAPAIAALARDNRCETVEAADLYDDLARRSLQYRDAFRPIARLRRNVRDGVVEATMQRPATAGEPAASYLLHPALLDGCFQAALALIAPDAGAYLPVSVAMLAVYAPLTEDFTCRVALRRADAAEVVCDIELIGADGTLLAEVAGLRCRSMRGHGAASNFPGGDYRREWTPLPALDADSAATTMTLLVAEAGDPLGDAMEAALVLRHIAVARCAWAEVADTARLRLADRVIGIARTGLASDADPCGEAELVDMLAAVQAMAAEDRALPLRIVTCCAHAVMPCEDVIPAQTAIAGFVRVVRNEQPLLDAATIDTDGREDGAAVAALVDEVLAAHAIEEVALRRGARFAAVMTLSGTLQAPAHRRVLATDNGALALVRDHAGVHAAAIEHPACPADGYVVRVDALAVRAGDEAGPCGLVGRIATAAADAPLPVGTRVAALARLPIATIVSLDPAEAAIVAVPHDMPITPLIAPIAARSRRIAAATGLAEGATALVSVGLLGDALAEALAAQGVIVTRAAPDLAGSLRATGHGPYQLIAMPLPVWSRDVGFAGLAAGGQLVDLSEDPASFVVPGHCARLLRLPDDLSALARDRAYADALADLGARAQPAPHGVARIGWAELFDGDPLGNAANGWIEIDIAGDTQPVTVAIPDLPVLRRDATYLITGGFGGLGQELAIWLAGRGAGHIALVGRRGGDTPGAAGLIATLRGLGAEASAHALDMGDAAAVQALVAGLANGPAPLAGIFHAAGVLEDKPLTELAANDMVRVLRPKAGGAWALHEAALAADCTLDQFVLFSSIAVLVGNSRQANYCAANGFLDGLAAHRHARGLPALSVQFGAIAGTGMLGEDARIGQHLTQIGLAPLDVDIALAGLGRALAKGLSHVAVAEPIAWDRWAAYEQVGGQSPAFADLVAASRAARGGDAGLVEELHRVVREVDDDTATGALRALVAEVVAVGLKSSADRINVNQSFDALGVDSLMSTEIQIQLEEKLGVGFSVVELLGPTTVAHLAGKALSVIRAGFPDPDAAGTLAAVSVPAE